MLENASNDAGGGRRGLETLVTTRVAETLVTTRVAAAFPAPRGSSGWLHYNIPAGQAAKIADSQPQLGALSDCKIDPQIAALFPKRHAPPDRQDSTDGAADATLEDDAALWSFVGEAGPKK